MNPLGIALLLVALLPAADLLWGRRRPARGRRYPRLLRAAWLRFGVPPVVLLGITGHWTAFAAMPPAFVSAVAAVGVGGLGPEDHRYLIAFAAGGVVVGTVAGIGLTAWRAWRGRPEGTMFGDAGLVRPGRGELGWAAALAVTAGVTEEAYFRLLLPLMTVAATGSAVAGFVGSTLLFGAAHRYQGWRGVVATTGAGAAMVVGYLATGSLVAMMVLHAAGDLGHLVLRPAVRGWVERGRGRGRGSGTGRNFG